MELVLYYGHSLTSFMVDSLRAWILSGRTLSNVSKWMALWFPYMRELERGEARTEANLV